MDGSILLAYISELGSLMASGNMDPTNKSHELERG